MLSTQDMPLVSIVKRLMIKLCSSISNLLFRSLFYFKISIMSMLCLSEVDFITKTFMFISFTFIPSLKLPLTLCNYFSQSHLSLIISEKLMQSHNIWRAGKKKVKPLMTLPLLAYLTWVGKTWRFSPKHHYWLSRDFK